MLKIQHRFNVSGRARKVRFHNIVEYIAILLIPSLLLLFGTVSLMCSPGIRNQDFYVLFVISGALFIAATVACVGLFLEREKARKTFERGPSASSVETLYQSRHRAVDSVEGNRSQQP